MRFELLTLGGTKYQGEVAEVVLRTTDGELGVLPGHEPLTAIVVAGPVTVQPRAGATEHFVSFGGLLEVRDNVARLLADEAEHADDLVHEEIEAALAKAHELKEAAQSRHEIHRAQELIDRHTVRLEVARIRRHHRERPGQPR